MPVTFRPARPEDEPFLYELYRSTRSEDLGAEMPGGPHLDALLRMQFTGQQHSYAAQYPRADHDIILLDGRPIGRVMVERGAEENRGVDIALLPEFRGSGVGGAIIQGLLDEARRAGKPFRIHVVRTNRAKRLYDRLGFKEIADIGTHYVMEWEADQ